MLSIFNFHSWCTVRCFCLCCLRLVHMFLCGSVHPPGCSLGPTVQRLILLQQIRGQGSGAPHPHTSSVLTTESHVPSTALEIQHPVVSVDRAFSELGRFRLCSHSREQSRGVSVPM